MTYKDTDVDWPDFESINTARGEVLNALKAIEQYLDEEGIDDMVGDVKRVRRDIAKRTEKEIVGLSSHHEVDESDWSVLSDLELEPSDRPSWFGATIDFEVRFKPVEDGDGAPVGMECLPDGSVVDWGGDSSDAEDQ